MHAPLNKYQMGNSRLLRTAEAMKIRSTGQLMYTACSIIEGEEARHDAYGEDMNTKWRIIVTIFVIGVTAISLYVNP